MSLSGISSTTPSYTSPLQNGFKQRADDFTALKTALQSGDISAAQSAFKTFKQDIQTAKSPSGSSQPSQDFQSLESALSTGDISSAQKAFAAFQADVQAAHKSHHHHHKAATSNDAQTQTGSFTPSADGLIGTVLNQQA